MPIDSKNSFIWKNQNILTKTNIIVNLKAECVMAMDRDFMALKNSFNFFAKIVGGFVTI